MEHIYWKNLEQNKILLRKGSHNQFGYERNKKNILRLEYIDSQYGTAGRTRTDTLLRAMDFESIVSTNFTTAA